MVCRSGLQVCTVQGSGLKNYGSGLCSVLKVLVSMLRVQHLGFIVVWQGMYNKAQGYLASAFRQFMVLDL